MRMVDRVRELADTKGCTPGQLALAWVHAQGSDVFPIPGTKRMKYLEVGSHASWRKNPICSKTYMCLQRPFQLRPDPWKKRFGIVWQRVTNWCQFLAGECCGLLLRAER